MVIHLPNITPVGRAVPCAPPWNEHTSRLPGGQKAIHTTLRQRGSLMVELMVAVALLLGVFLPLAYSLASERRLARAYYNRAVAMEIVDGEMEALLAGEWRAFRSGTHEYMVRSAAATNLPPGRFRLTVQPDKLRLRWQPALKDVGGAVTREASIR